MGFLMSASKRGRSASALRRKVTVPSLSPTSVPTWLSSRGTHSFNLGKTCVEMRGSVPSRVPATCSMSRALVKDVRLGTLASRLTPLNKKVTLLGAQCILGDGCVVEGDEELGAPEGRGKGAAAARAGEQALFPLASPQMWPLYRVCSGTPHPPLLLRHEHGQAPVRHGLVEEGPSAGARSFLLISPESLGGGCCGRV